MKDRFTEANPFAYRDAVTKHHSSVDEKEDDERDRGGAYFGAPRSTSVLYQNFLYGLHATADSEDLTFTIIISDPLSNSFVGPVPTKSAALSLRDESRTSGTTTIPMSKKGWRSRIHSRSYNFRTSQALQQGNFWVT